MIRTLVVSLLTSAVFAKAPTCTSSPWQPAVGAKWQIMITNNVSIAIEDKKTPPEPVDADIWDVDMFNTPSSVFQQLHAQGKKVICYFSAGSSEDWRPDFSKFPAADIGEPLACWPGEKWINYKSPAIWEIMQKRIQLASNKGCDAIDPDNVDGFNGGGGGFNLTADDAIAYVKRLSAEAKRWGMSTGLKNAQELIEDVIDDIAFAVNESCEQTDDCNRYDPLIAAGKPVFHIEYIEKSLKDDGNITMMANDPALRSFTTDDVKDVLCLKSTLRERVANASAVSDQFSTVIKQLKLDGWTYYCDDTTVETNVTNVGTGGPQVLPCGKDT